MEEKNEKKHLLITDSGIAAIDDEQARAINELNNRIFSKIVG